MQTVYIEKAIIQHPRVERILQRIQPEHIIECGHYKEIFNPKNQNFRIQKQQPALILAQKQGQRVFHSPAGFGVGGEVNYYFSHMLNCLYDCRYCFLQGMYSSAHYVLFVNYEDFMQEIEEKILTASSSPYFFSGYDCDSLAFEPVSQFLQEFLPFFREQQNGILELRTKSMNVKELLKQPAFKNCIVAFSFTPEEISREVEHKVPNVTKRIQAMKSVVEAGWSIGLRFDPLIYHPEFKQIYRNLITDIFAVLPTTSLHSVSTGPLRFPDKMYQKIVKLYPQDPLLAQPLYRQNNIFSYQKENEKLMKHYLHELLSQYVKSSLLFECHV